MKKTFEERLLQLNKVQRQAVETTEGPLLILAGPGTGKTELLALRVAHILKEGLASPSSILCVTFTDNGSINMRKRLEGLLGSDAYRVHIFTFHAFCNHIIASYPEYFYNATHFSLASPVTRMNIMEHIFKKLPHKHPLSSFHSTLGFAYIQDSMSRIGDIKSGGFDPISYRSLCENFLEEAKKVDAILANWNLERLSIKKIAVYAQIQKDLEICSKENITAKIYAQSLQKAIDDAVAENKTEAIALWKKKYTRLENDILISKDTSNAPKIIGVAEIYEAYQKAMYEEGVYDYDDMILDVSRALKEEESMRHDIEESYSYIMIDEFQDTNDAQMNIIRQITSSHHHEGRPNVCAVGDDDQAIYKFQGAEVSNMLFFKEHMYRDVALIVLDVNYRSHQHILDFSRNIITQGKARLENNIDAIHKVLTQGNKTISNANVEVKQFENPVYEYQSVAKKVATLLQSGGQGDRNVAILSRKHSALQNIVPYLDREHIAYNYSKKVNVFDEPHIQQLIIMAEYIASYKEAHIKDALLISILSFPFWNIDKKMLLSIAISARQKNISWSAALSTSDNDTIVSLYTFLQGAVVACSSLPLSLALTYIMEKSPFKEYYFSQEKLEGDTSTYIQFLSSLRTLLEALAEWKEGELITLSSLSLFVETHRAHHIPLTSTIDFTHKENRVTLLSTHGAKGLEFDSVFIIDADDSTWTKGGMISKASIPSALIPILSKAGDDEDDFIRLLYVALTRAKSNLYISTSGNMLRYIQEQNIQHVESVTDEVSIEALETTLFPLSYIQEKSVKTMLSPLVEKYIMPVTHMQNFLNVIEGGPAYFLKQNLLRFPQPMNVSGVYGSAIHKAIEELITYTRYHGGETPTLEHIQATFLQMLQKGRLDIVDTEKCKARGEKVLKAYYAKNKNSFLPDDMVEVDMRDGGVIVDGAHIGGKIDFLRKTKEGYEIADFKTGDSYTSFDEKDLQEYEKIKLHFYKMQLIMYHILLEESNTYSDAHVSKLSLIYVEDMTELTYTPTRDEIERVKKLIGAIYKKIVTLDFPDVSTYSKNLKGVKEFEEDLIAGAEIR